MTAGIHDSTSPPAGRPRDSAARQTPIVRGLGRQIETGLDKLTCPISRGDNHPRRCLTRWLATARSPPSCEEIVWLGSLSLIPHPLRV